MAGVMEVAQLAGGGNGEEDPAAGADNIVEPGEAVTDLVALVGSLEAERPGRVGLAVPGVREKCRSPFSPTAKIVVAGGRSGTVLPSRGETKT